MGVRGNSGSAPDIIRCSSSPSALSDEKDDASSSSSSSQEPRCQMRGTYFDSPVSDGSSSENGELQPRPRSIPPLAHSLSDTVLFLQSSNVMRTASLPSFPVHRPVPSRERPCPPKGIRVSQARLVIPRTISEYFDCCRFCRSHSEGLLFAQTTPTDAMTGCRNLAPNALSEGLLGGHLFAAATEGRDCERPATPQDKTPSPPLDLDRLQQGMQMEGRIVRCTAAGLLVDVGATHMGFFAPMPLQRCSKEHLAPG